MSDDCGTCADLFAQMPDGSTCEVGADGDLTPIIDKLVDYIAGCVQIAVGDLIEAQVVGDVLCLDIDKGALAECLTVIDGNLAVRDDSA